MSKESKFRCTMIAVLDEIEIEDYDYSKNAGRMERLFNDPEARQKIRKIKEAIRDLVD